MVLGLQPRQRRADRRGTVAEVRPESDVRARHAATVAALLLAVTAALAAAPDAGARGARTGAEPVGAGTLRSLAAEPYALVALDRARGFSAEVELRRAGGELVSRELLVWKVPSRAAQRLVPRLARLGQLRRVEPNRTVRIHYAGHITSGDPLVPQQWWLAAVGADRVEPPGPGRPVTVIDSGLDVSHPEFSTRPDTSVLNPQTIDAEETARLHGTAVSSVVGAPANGYGIVGVYPQARLQSWDLTPAGTIDVASLIAGIEAASSRGPGVINLSVGFGRFDPILAEAVLVAFRRGTLVVAASGNEFQAGNPILFPANMTHVLTVAATDRSGASSAFSSSSLGVDLAAPGEEILAAVPVAMNPSFPFAALDGTSFAAPIVAGAAAWVWTARPSLHITQLFDLMRWSARDIDRPGFDRDTGFGMLDIPTALTTEAPARDGQEPNDDIDQVKANGLFRAAATPLTRPGRGNATVVARIDVTEDPEDVYRVWVPARRRVTITLASPQTVTLELWNATTPSVAVRGAQRRRHLIAVSARPGSAVERASRVNRGRRGEWIYVDVFTPRGGDLAAGYRLTIRTTSP